MDIVTATCVYYHNSMQSDFTAFRLNVWHFDRFRIGEGTRYDWHCSAVSTPHWRIFWNREPGAVVAFDGTDYPLDPESVIVITPRTPIDTRVTGSVDHAFIHAMLGYPYDRVSPGIETVPAAQLPMNQLDRALTPADYGEDRAQHLDLQETLAVQSFVCGVLSWLPKDIWAKPPSNPAIRALAEEIAQYPERTYRSATMAKRCHVSVNTLLNHFKEQVGQTPQQFVTECRLQKACALLSQTTYSIEQIAEACGYCDRYHLSKVFKAHYRCGPATFRDHPIRLATIGN